MTDATVSHLRPESQGARATRAAFVHDALREERWTVRQMALRIGLSPAALGDRMKGKVAFLAEDLEDIALVLKVDPVAFYRDYLAAASHTPPALRDVPKTAGLPRSSELPVTDR